MRAAVLTGHGGFECLSFRHDVPVPVPATGEVLVKVSAAAVNNTDINTRIGWYEGGGWTGGFQFPRIQGIDACGRIVGVGAGVPAGRVGERVLVEPCWREPGAALSTARFLGSEVDGAFAEYLVAPARHAHAVDSTLTDVDLATFPCSYSTAENLLCRAGVKAGEQVLITGASGGVGSAAVQLARARGAVVTAVAGVDKHEQVRGVGADVVLDRSADVVSELGAGAIDVVIDVVGGDAWPSLLQVLRAGGRYATAGAIAGAIVQLDLRTLYLKDLHLIGCTVLDDGVFAALVRRIERGEIHPLVASVFPLEQLVAAQQRFLEKAHVGKIVIDLAAAA